MDKEVIILGDTEIGVGNITDDFISDNALSALILSLKERKHPVDLVFNGDTFDFLKAPAIINGVENYPRKITKEISLNKLQHMIKAHEKVFKSLKTFNQDDKNKVVFVIGNHDADLHFKEVQEELNSTLKGNVEFVTEYQHKSVHAEHGNEFDSMNRVGNRAMVALYRGKEILNLPWVSMGTIDLTSLKQEHPFLERIQPRPRLFEQHSGIKYKVNKRSILFTLKSILLMPLSLIDPTRWIQWELLSEAFERFKRADYEVSTVLTNFRDRKKVKDTQIHVLGHTHNREILKKGNKVYIDPDTWRDEYSLDDNGILTSKPKNYVQVLIDGEETKWNVLTWPIKRSSWKLSDVDKDERSFREQAAAEEGYTYRLATE